MCSFNGGFIFDDKDNILWPLQIYEINKMLFKVLRFLKRFAKSTF
jgi:hypothetical protein